MNSTVDFAIHALADDVLESVAFYDFSHMKGIITGIESLDTTHLVDSDRDEHCHLLICIKLLAYSGSIAPATSPSILSALLP